MSEYGQAWDDLCKAAGEAMRTIAHAVARVPISVVAAEALAALVMGDDRAAREALASLDEASRLEVAAAAIRLTDLAVSSCESPVPADACLNTPYR